jgi:branched-chain amino acid transport system permease protein
MTVKNVLRWWKIPVLLILLVYPWLLRAPYYHVLGFNVLLLATMATSWNIMGGYTGYKSLGHSTFYGLGAYFVALAANEWDWNPLLSAPFLAIGVAVIALILGWIMLRTSGAAFVISTIAMMLIFSLLALNLRDITGGAPGLSQPLAPWTPEFSRMPFYYYMLGVLIVAISVSAYVRRSRFGLGLLAIRDDEGKAEMVGVNTTLYKVLSFGLSAYFVALGGGVWSYFTTHISPIFAFDILTSVDMILMTILGGQGTVWGPVLGAFILVPAKDLILFNIDKVFSFAPSQFHLVFLGVIMLLIVVFLPRGILPTVSDWLEERRSPRMAHAGARSMAEMSAAQAAEDSAAKMKGEVPS